MAMGWNKAFNGIKKVAGGLRSALTIDSGNASRVINKTRNYVNASRIGKKARFGTKAFRRHTNARRLFKAVSEEIPNAAVTKEPAFSLTDPLQYTTKSMEFQVANQLERTVPNPKYNA